MKIHSRFFVLCAVALLFGTLYTATRAHLVSQQLNQRSIGRLRPERDEPLRIRAVRAKGRSVRRNEKFDADDDWLRELTIRVKNVSGKRILFASIDLLFPAAEPGGPRAIDQIDYGNRELLTRPPTPNELRSGIEPQQEVDIQLNGIAYDRVRSLLADIGYVGIPRVELRLGRVIFQDDSTWYAGSPFRRDARDSKNWTNVEKPVQAGNASVGVTNSLARIVPASDTSRSNAAGKPSTGQLPVGWNSLFPRDSFPQLDTLLIRTSYHTAPAQSSSNCYRIVNSQNVWCNLQLSCTHLKDYTDMLPGSYTIQNWPTSCTDTLGNWCGLDSTTTRITCVFPGGGGGGGGGGGESGGCWSDWDCFAGEYCDQGTGSCYEYGSGPGGIIGE